MSADKNAPKQGAMSEETLTTEALDLAPPGIKVLDFDLLC